MGCRPPLGLFQQLATAHDPERDMDTVAGTLTDWPASIA
jgi:hypothetical protein